MMMMMIS